jgi:hypothetical protein
VLEYTPEQIDLYVELAAERQSREIVAMASAMAAGAATGFSGSTKPLETFQRAMLGTAVGARSAIQVELQDRLQEMARAAGVEMPRPGAARRARIEAARQGRRSV